MDAQTRFTNTTPGVWHGEAFSDGVVVARARIEIDYEGQPTLTRLLLLDADSRHVVTLIEECAARWPSLDWQPRIIHGDGATFERFFFLQHPSGGPYCTIGVLTFGNVVPLGTYELTNDQMDWLTRHPEDYPIILGLKGSAA